MHWIRKWQPTPVFLSGESQGWESLVGCRLGGRTELDTTEAMQQQQQQQQREHNQICCVNSLLQRETENSIGNKKERQN